MSKVVYPNDWQEHRLTDMANYHNGLAFKPADWSEDGVRIIRIEQLNNPEGDYDHFNGFFPDVNAINDGDLIFSWSATLKVLIWRYGKAVLNQHLFKVVPKSGFDKHYLYFLLDFHMDGLGSGSHGSTMKHIKRGELDKYFVRLPSQPEQKKISEVLAIIDTAIEKTEALIAKYQQIKAGLMHDLFTCGVTADGKLRPPREQAPELYQETPIGWIPKEWRSGVLDNFSDIHNNLRKPLSGEIRETMQGEYPYYGPTGILDYINEFLVEGEFCLIGEDGDHFLKFADWPMTLLVSGRFNVNNHAHILSGRNGVSTRWLHAFFLHRDITFHLTRQGAGRFKLNKAALKALPIYVPEPAEQEEILDRLEAAHSLVEAQFKQLEKLRQQKLGLMHDLLTGKVRVAV
jgi:type I restriction enzyme S subunit